MKYILQFGLHEIWTQKASYNCYHDNPVVGSGRASILKEREQPGFQPLPNCLHKRWDAPFPTITCFPRNSTYTPENLATWKKNIVFRSTFWIGVCSFPWNGSFSLNKTEGISTRFCESGHMAARQRSTRFVASMTLVPIPGCFFCVGKVKQSRMSRWPSSYM